MLSHARNGLVRTDAFDMHYVRFGQGKRVFVVIPGLSDGLHTVKGRARMLEGAYRPFFKDFTVYMFSRRNALKEGMSIRDMAADQARAMEAIGITRACVMGISQGGMIAQYLAIDHPETVERLVLAVSAPEANPTLCACVEKWMGLAREGDFKRLLISVSENSYSPEKLQKMRRLYPLIPLLGKPKSFDRYFVNANAILHFDASDEVSRITCPTFIIGGAEDKTVTAEGSHRLHELIAESRLHIFPGYGHAAFMEMEKDFNKLVLGFLNESLIHR